MNGTKDTGMVKQHCRMMIHTKECTKMVKEMAKEHTGRDLQFYISQPANRSDGFHDNVNTFCEIPVV